MAGLASLGVVGVQRVHAQPGRIVGWGNVPTSLSPPQGQFTRVAIGGGHALALRTDGTMVAWGDNFYGQATAQPGTFLDVAAGVEHSVALRSDGTAVSWGLSMYGEAVTPPGTFVAISAGYRCSGGIRPDGTLFVWGLWGATSVPSGTFQAISVGGAESLAAIRTDGTMVTWANASPAIPGTFTRVNISYLSSALRSDGTAVTFGGCGAANYPAPPGTFVQLSSSSSGYPGALHSDGAIAVWGPHPVPSELNPPPGRFSFVAMGPGFGFAIQPCYANCDGSTSGPTLSANDFMCFLNNFASGSFSANCDNSTTAPVLNANDFQCFLNQFAAGCS